MTRSLTRLSPPSSNALTAPAYDGLSDRVGPRGDSMPGLGGRFTTLVKAKVSAVLDRAEDPAETLDYSYEKQLELLQNVKSGIAHVVTSEKRLPNQVHWLE